MDYLVVDFEFTFYKKPIGRPRTFFSEIIEIGAVKFIGDSLKQKCRLQNFVQPKFFPRQAMYAMEFCMITPRDMESAIPFPKMLKKLSALYEENKTFFVAWGTSDYNVLDQCCYKHKLSNPIQKKDYLDLAEAYRLWKGVANTPSLKTALSDFELDADGLAHTALDDAHNTGKVLLKMLEAGWTYEAYVEAREEWVAAHLAKKQTA